MFGYGALGIGRTLCCHNSCMSLVDRLTDDRRSHSKSQNTRPLGVFLVLYSSFPAYPDCGVGGGVFDFENSMKGNECFLGFIMILDCEVGFSKLIDAGRSYLPLVSRETSVAVGYQIVVGVFLRIPPKPVEHVLEGMNHEISSTLFVTEFVSTKPLLVRLRRECRIGCSA